MLRKKFLIKPKLQFKYMIITALVVLLSAVVVYFVLHQVMRSSGGMEQLTDGEWRSLTLALNRGLVWIVAFIALVLAVESVFFFHRMVGPLYVFEKVLRAIKEGDLTQRVHLRQGDEFKEIAGEYNQMSERLDEKIKEAADALNAIPLDSGNLSSDAKDKILKARKALEFFKTK